MRVVAHNRVLEFGLAVAVIGAFDPSPAAADRAVTMLARVSMALIGGHAVERGRQLERPARKRPTMRRPGRNRKMLTHFGRSGVPVTTVVCITLLYVDRSHVRPYTTVEARACLFYVK